MLEVDWGADNLSSSIKQALQAASFHYFGCCPECAGTCHCPAGHARCSSGFTTTTLLQEGTKEASPEAAERASEQEVKDSVKSRVVSGSQTT